MTKEEECRVAINVTLEDLIETHHAHTDTRELYKRAEKAYADAQDAYDNACEAYTKASDAYCDATREDK